MHNDHPVNHGHILVNPMEHVGLVQLQLGSYPMGVKNRRQHCKVVPMKVEELQWQAVEPQHHSQLDLNCEHPRLVVLVLERRHVSCQAVLARKVAARSLQAQFALVY